MLTILLIFLLIIIKAIYKKNNKSNREWWLKKNVEILEPLKYLSNFWKKLEFPLTNCEINLILTCSADCVTLFGAVANQATKITITDAKLYVPVVTLSTQTNAKILQQLKSGFKKRQSTGININQK